jgi:hypothetical protein
MFNTRQKRAFYLSLGLLALGAAGYFLTERGLPVFYISAHMGALGLLGLFGSLAGVLANKKRHNYWVAFWLGTLLPLLAGWIGVLVFLLGKDKQFYCGGSVSLVVAFLIIFFYLLVKKASDRSSEPSV